MYIPDESNDEINDIITAVLNDLTKGNTTDHKFCDLIRFLKKARTTLRSAASDEEGHHAKRVISALARVQRWLVKHTVLRQEQDLQTAIQLLQEKIEHVPVSLADQYSNRPDGYSS